MADNTAYSRDARFVAAEAVEAGTGMLRGTVVGQTESTVYVQWRPGFPPEPCHRYGRSAPRYLTAADLAAAPEGQT
jgi:hypothetical protein